MRTFVVGSFLAALSVVSICEAAHAAPPVYQPTPELKFILLPKACRAFNLTIPGKTTKTLKIAATGGFPSQGGKSGGCGIPVSAAAVFISLTTGTAVAKGVAVAWATGQPKPNLITTSFPQGGNVTIGTMVPVASTGTIDLRSSKTAKFTGDVIGYYVPPLAGMIASSGAAYSGSPRILGSTRIGLGVYEVQFDRNIRYCAAAATVYVSAYYASATTWYDSTRPDTVRVSVFDHNGAPIDQYFYISVHC